MKTPTYEELLKSIQELEVKKKKLEAQAAAAKEKSKVYSKRKEAREKAISAIIAYYKTIDTEMDGAEEKRISKRLDEGFLSIEKVYDGLNDMMSKEIDLDDDDIIRTFLKTF